MRSPWYKPFVLETLNDSWDSYPASAGVYMIMSDRPIPRIGRVDDKGIIYIGKAKNLRNRLWRFLKIQHTASDFLWFTHSYLINLLTPILSLSIAFLKIGK